VEEKYGEKLCESSDLINFSENMHSTMSRQDFFEYYTQFKALATLSGMDNPRAVIGVDFENFVNGVKEASVDNRELVYKIFNHCNDSTTGYLDWQSFMKAIALLRPFDLEHKLESFLCMVATHEKPDHMALATVSGDSSLSEREHNVAIDQSLNMKDVRELCFQNILCA